MIRRSFAALVFCLVASMAQAQPYRIDDMVFDVNPRSDIARPSATTYFAQAFGQPWTNHLIPVQFSWNATPEQRAQFFRVCGEWTKVAGIGCIPRTVESHFALATSVGATCYSHVGAANPSIPGISPVRQINLPHGCWNDQMIAHEIGHLLGLGHEHQRSDRDAYITVAPGCAGYEIIPGTPLITGYDFQSIMHYPLSSCIQLKPAYAGWAPLIGTGIVPSAWDAYTAALIYGPPLPQYYPTPVNFRLVGADAVNPIAHVSWLQSGTASSWTVDVSTVPMFTSKFTNTFSGAGATGTSQMLSGTLWPGQVYFRVTGIWDALGLRVSSPTVISYNLPGTWTRPYLFQPRIIGNEVSYGWAGPSSDQYLLVFRTSPTGSPISIFPVGYSNNHTGPAPNGTFYVSVYSTTLPESNQVIITVPR